MHLKFRHLHPTDATKIYIENDIATTTNNNNHLDCLPSNIISYIISELCISVRYSLQHFILLFSMQIVIFKLFNNLIVTTNTISDIV